MSIVQTEHQLNRAQATQEYIDKKYHEFECTQALNKIQQTLHILINLEQKIHLLINLKQNKQSDETHQQSTTYFPASNEPAVPRRPQIKLGFDPFKKI